MLCSWSIEEDSAQSEGVKEEVKDFFLFSDI